LTYRYILTTGLLAKATDKRVNALTLQAGSNLPGAYDARSLCHKVLVPVERQLLDRGLGGSNEPFLNKPARFTEISSANAVRKGSDAAALKTLHKVLSEIKSDENAFDALAVAIFYILQRNEAAK